VLTSLYYIMLRYKHIVMLLFKRNLLVPKHDLWRWYTQNVPKRRYIKFRRRGTTHKKEYNIQNKAEFWSQEMCLWYVNEGTQDCVKGSQNPACLSDGPSSKVEHAWGTTFAFRPSTVPAVRYRGSAPRLAVFAPVQLPNIRMFPLTPTLPPNTKGQVWPSGPPPNSPLIMLFSPHWHHEYCSDDWNNDQDSCVNYCLILFPLSRVYICLCRPGLGRPSPPPSPHFVTTAFPKAMMNTRDRIWLQSSMVLNKMITVE